MGKQKLHPRNFHADELEDIGIRAEIYTNSAFTDGRCVVFIWHRRFETMIQVSRQDAEALAYFFDVPCGADTFYLKED